MKIEKLQVRARDWELDNVIVKINEIIDVIKKVINEKRHIYFRHVKGQGL